MMPTGCHADTPFIQLMCSVCVPRSSPELLQVNFFGPETMEEKAAVFAPLRQMDSISVS